MSSIQSKHTYDVAERPVCGHEMLSGQVFGFTAAPLEDGPDVSWLPKCRVWDDQTQYGACVIFAFASWCEIMYGVSISDGDCVTVYLQALKDNGLEFNSGLTYEMGLAAVVKAGWLPATTKLHAEPNLSAITGQPLLAAYAVTPAWDKPNSAGCLDHNAGGKVRGYHAVVIAAKGVLSSVNGWPYVWIENSWGEWGWKGIGMMSDTLHLSMIQEVYSLQGAA